MPKRCPSCCTSTCPMSMPPISAVKAGATSIMEPSDQFYGDRSGGVKDAVGNSWFFGTHIEDVAPAELKRRAAEAFKKQKAA